MRLTDVQELAVQAVIGSYVGHEEFDNFFAGMRCGPVMDGGFVLFVHNEYYANHVLGSYSAIIALAVLLMIGVEINAAGVAPIDIQAPVSSSTESFLRSHFK